MNEDGYTLVEMMAALAMIGLAIGGVAESAHAVKLIQTATVRSLGQDQTLARAQRGLARLFESEGPFRSDDAVAFTGGAAAFDFDCGAPARCGASLSPHGDDTTLTLAGPGGSHDRVVLRGLRGASFAYHDLEGQRAAWPPSGQRRSLRSVTLASASSPQATAIATARVWVEQAPDCAFDPIMEDCRSRVR